MPTPFPQVLVPLAAMPEIALAARGTHGRDGRIHQETYLLPQHWCLHAYEYSAEIQLGNHLLKLTPGILTLFPPNSLLHYRYQARRSHSFVHFTLPATGEDWLEVPVLQDAGTDFPWFQAGLGRLAESSGPMLGRRVALWDILWRYAELSRPGLVTDHNSVRRAVALINANLHEPISVRDLARECGLSHNQLTRLFRGRFGTTVVGYIRGQRVTRALHLLEQSSLPLQSVAVQCGFPDARQLSAILKMETGRTPREWRRGPLAEE